MNLIGPCIFQNLGVYTRLQKIEVHRSMAKQLQAPAGRPVATAHTLHSCSPKPHSTPALRDHWVPDAVTPLAGLLLHSPHRYGRPRHCPSGLLLPLFS